MNVCAVCVYCVVSLVSIFFFIVKDERELCLSAEKYGFVKFSKNPYNLALILTEFQFITLKVTKWL